MGLKDFIHAVFNHIVDRCDDGDEHLSSVTEFYESPF